MRLDGMLMMMVLGLTLDVASLGSGEDFFCLSLGKLGLCEGSRTRALVGMVHGGGL